MTQLLTKKTKTQREKMLDRLAVEIANLVADDDLVKEMVEDAESLAMEKTDKGEQKAWAHTMPSIKNHIMAKYADKMPQVSRVDMAIAKRKPKVKG